MGARTDLMEVAGALATEARRLTDVPRAEQDEGYESIAKIGNVEFRSTAAQAAEIALGAKAALEAAALVDADPAPIIAALDRLVARLGDWDDAVADVLAIEGPAAAIDQAAELLAFSRVEVAVGAAVQHGYLKLKEALIGMHRDFDAANTETARRYVTRIEMALDAADAAITEAKGQEAAHG